MKIHPLYDKIVIKADKKPEKTVGGIYLPQDNSIIPQRGLVLHAGSGYLDRLEGGCTPLTVKEGDRVLFGKYSGVEIELEGEKVLVMGEEDILAILTEEKLDD